MPTIVTRLKKKAQIINSELNAYVNIDGSKQSICVDNPRTEKLQELKDTYSKIHALDPDFQSPFLPSEVGYRMVSNSLLMHWRTLIDGSKAKKAMDTSMEFTL